MLLYCVLISIRHEYGGLHFFYKRVNDMLGFIACYKSINPVTLYL
jgi:hypothetical protein